MGKGQKPANPVLSSLVPPKRGGQHCFLAQRRETNVLRQNKGKDVQKTPQNLAAGFRAFPEAQDFSPAALHPSTAV